MGTLFIKRSLIEVFTFVVFDFRDYPIAFDVFLIFLDPSLPIGALAFASHPLFVLLNRCGLIISVEVVNRRNLTVGNDSFDTLKSGHGIFCFMLCLLDFLVFGQIFLADEWPISCIIKLNSIGVLELEQKALHDEC